VRRLVLARATFLLELGLRRVRRAGWVHARRAARIGALALALAGAAPAPSAAETKLRVAATLPDLFVLTRAVAGEAATVELIARFGQNPHDMEVRPSHMLLLRRADVLVKNGLEEDAWVEVMVRGAANPKVIPGSRNVIDASQGIQVLKIPAGRVDRSMGDVHPLGSPHYTLDPDNLVIVTQSLAAGLARAAPEHARLFEANRHTLLEKIAEADRRWKATLAPFRGARVVSFHDSWPYFYRAFGLVEGGIIEDRPGIPPSPQHLAWLIRQMRDEKVRVILHESWYPRDITERVARETGARMLVVPQTPGAVKGTEDYIAHMDYLVGAIADALR
jgi:zinc/manganese transport system substrate-binding protein